MLHSVLWAHYDDVNIPYLQTSNYFVFCYCKWIFLCVILAYMCQFTLGTIYSGRTARCSDKQLQHLLDRGLLGENSKLLSRVAAPTSSETNNTRKFIFLPIIKIWDALHFWNTICASLFFICIFSDCQWDWGSFGKFIGHSGFQIWSVLIDSFPFSY